MVCMGDSRAWADAEPKAAEPGAAEPGAGVGIRAVKKKKPALLSSTLPALLCGTLLVMLLGLLSLEEPTDFSNMDLGAEQHEGFFWDVIAGEA